MRYNFVFCNHQMLNLCRHNHQLTAHLYPKEEMLLESLNLISSNVAYNIIKMRVFARKHKKYECRIRVLRANIKLQNVDSPARAGLAIPDRAGDYTSTPLIKVSNALPETQKQNKCHNYTFPSILQEVILLE